MEIQRHNVQERVEKAWESLNCKGKSGKSQWRNHGGPPELVGPLDPPLLLSLSLEKIKKEQHDQLGKKDLKIKSF